MELEKRNQVMGLFDEMVEAVIEAAFVHQLDPPTFTKLQLELRARRERAAELLGLTDDR